MDNDEKTPGPSDDRERLDAATSARAEAPTERLEEASAPATASAGNETRETTTEADGRRRRTRRILIGTGAAVALLAFGGGAFAIGNAVTDDDDDDRPGVHAPAARGGDARGGQPGPADDRDGDRDARPGDDTGAASAPADAAALRAAAEAAIAHASAEGITSIEIERGGYDIDARSADGDEVELFVTPEGAVRERGDDDTNDDSEDDPLIDLERLADLLAAAQSAADDAGATQTAFHALSTSSSGAVYEVELRAASRDEVEVELDADLNTMRVDIDS